MKKIIIVLIGSIWLLACQKKVISEGIVYTKQNIPVANATVTIAEYANGSDFSHKSEGTTTDNNGKFMFNYLTAKNRSFSIDVSSAKGSMHIKNLSREQLKHIDIHLAQ